ncbi:MAG: amidohydrolase/deacetylase family metallohydrolase [Acidobacteria bacterium]|nr:amidohydrolase/deacetylase family metallohydrolase [Acidobacteriota bacterium]MBI3471866.1 amidohydrolase/deacetylase family metallohydrolase [Candidatus Solibacter usitatus]
MRKLAYFLALPLAAQPVYDLVLKGGHVIDPKNNLNAVRDVAISGGKIAAVAADIPADKAKRVADVSSLYVVPGLVDIHVHVYAGTGLPGVLTGDSSVYPDPLSFRGCVTTMVDAGSAGWANFADFKQRVITRARTRVLSFVNIVGGGMGPGSVEQDPAQMDAQRAAAVVKANRDLIVGIKTAHYTGPEWVAVERAVEAGTLANVPVIVDFGQFRPERPFQELVLKKLRPGDIYTHTFLGRVPMIDENGRVRPYLFEAKKRGILFDVGHGSGSFLFRQAVPAVKQGFVPDSISTDLHTGSMNGGMKEMANVMSKFLNLGMALEDVVRRSTWNPAREIHREELGNLSVGAGADIAVLRLDRGDFGFLDIEGKRFRGRQRLSCELTLRDGQTVWDLNGRAADDWDRK